MLGNLRGALAGTTVLMVASRPSTIALADEVVFLAGGGVVDHGRHDELMARQRRLPGAGRGVRDRSGDGADDAEAYAAGWRGRRRWMSPSAASAPSTRSTAACRRRPCCARASALTWLLAAVGATGRVVVPILLQQAIDKGIVGDGERAGRVRRRARRDRRGRPGDRRASPSARPSCASGGAASRRCTSCGPA